MKTLETQQTQLKERGLRRKLTGVVTSDKMQKTIVVQVTRRVKHEQYKKYINIKKKFHAHDEKEQASMGDLVLLEESRPLSKFKRWILKEVVKKNENS